MRLVDKEVILRMHFYLWRRQAYYYLMDTSSNHTNKPNATLNGNRFHCQRFSLVRLSPGKTVYLVRRITPVVVDVIIVHVAVHPLCRRIARPWSSRSFAAWKRGIPTFKDRREPKVFRNESSESRKASANDCSSNLDRRPEDCSWEIGHCIC